MTSGTPIRAIDVHSHWSTKRGYPLQTEAELSRLQHTWRAERIYRGEAEMAEDFRQAGVRTILDFGYTKYLTIDEVAPIHDYGFEVQQASVRARLLLAPRPISPLNGWFARLGRFAEAHPEIELRLSATMHHVDFAGEDVDLAIRHGNGNWPGLDAVNLTAEELFPVCSPSLMTNRGGIHEPEDVLRFPLLHLDDRLDWSRWLEAAGAPSEGLLHGPILNHASMLIDAAIDGQSVALARTVLASSDLIAGRLVRPRR
jgi:LysR substrate binding domain